MIILDVDEWQARGTKALCLVGLQEKTAFITKHLRSDQDNIGNLRGFEQHGVGSPYGA
jgi:hypothetical protein